MSDDRIAWGVDDARRFATLRPIRSWRGGAAYTSERGGRYFIVVDDSSLAAFLAPQRQADADTLADALSEQVLVIEFLTDEDRATYLREVFFPGDAAAGASGGTAGSAPSHEALRQLLGDAIFRRWQDAWQDAAGGSDA